ncbi:MAG: DUF2721 domain-containing protein [Gammaproteobacteria bacterium]|nr:DUF2721 domain-containing protein [Gammaproteobacteria bacterium]
MTLLPDHVHDIAGAIQLALAPAFLLTGIAGMLNVMTGRLGRIMDRSRAVVVEASGGDAATLEWMRRQLRTLERRRRYASYAITACTIAALLLCSVIASLFIEAMFDAPLKWLIGGLFTAATITLVVGLSFFLREVHMAMRTIRIPGGEGE